MPRMAHLTPSCPVSGQPADSLGQFYPRMYNPKYLPRDNTWGYTMVTWVCSLWEGTVGHLSPVQCLDPLPHIPQSRRSSSFSSNTLSDGGRAWLPLDSYDCQEILPIAPSLSSVSSRTYSGGLCTCYRNVDGIEGISVHCCIDCFCNMFFHLRVRCVRGAVTAPPSLF